MEGECFEMCHGKISPERRRVLCGGCICTYVKKAWMQQLGEKKKGQWALDGTNEW